MFYCSTVGYWQVRPRRCPFPRRSGNDVTREFNVEYVEYVEYKGIERYRYRE
jgi:hypothetical protein